MARREIIEVTCDICGSTTDVRAKSTRNLLVDGKEYTLDLCFTHTTELDNAMASFVAAARRASGRGVAAGARKRGSRSRLGSTPRPGAGNEIRQWARANGFANIGEVGRMPADAVAAWQAWQTATV